MALKRDKHDIVFSNLIRERNDYHCEYCGRCFRYNPSLLHCSHFQGRRSVATRFHPDNASAHCAGCHRKLTEMPGEHTKWIENKLGEQRILHVIQLSKTPKKLKKWLKEDVYKAMKLELEELNEKRDNGKVGYIEFRVPDFYYSGDY